MLPRAHGHQLKSITDYAAAIIAHKQPVRPNWHTTLAIEKLLVAAVFLRALYQRPRSEKIRLAID
jgi:hypothetical protein